MIRFLLPILLLTILFPALAFGETYSDLVKRDGVYFKKRTDVPFTGKVTGDEQGSLKDGKKVGPWVTYWDNGQLKLKVTYKDGKEDGPYLGYRKNGQLDSKGTYKNGKKEGPWVRYDYDDGTVWEMMTGTYKNGLKVK